MSRVLSFSPCSHAAVGVPESRCHGCNVVVAAPHAPFPCVLTRSFALPRRAPPPPTLPPLRTTPVMMRGGTCVSRRACPTVPAQREKGCRTQQRAKHGLLSALNEVLQRRRVLPSVIAPRAWQAENERCASARLLLLYCWACASGAQNSVPHALLIIVARRAAVTRAVYEAAVTGSVSELVLV